MVRSVVVRQGEVEVRGQLDASQVEPLDFILRIQVSDFEGRDLRRRIPIITRISNVVIRIRYVACFSKGWIRAIRSKRCNRELLSIEPHVDFLIIGSDFHGDVRATLVLVKLRVKEGPVGWSHILSANC